MKQLIKTAGQDSSHSERGNLDPSERSPSITTRTMSLAGRSSGEEPPTETGQIHRSNPARGGEQFLVVRGVSLVYVREHISNVRTVEQILFKYSPGDNAAERSWSRQFTLIVVSLLLTASTSSPNQHETAD